MLDLRTWLRTWTTKLKLLYLLDLDVDRGELSFDDTRVILPPAHLLAATRDRMEDIGPAGQRFLYETGKEAGKEYAAAVEEIVGQELEREGFADICAEFGAYTGWGDHRIEKMDFDNDEYVVTVGNTPFRNDREEKTGEYHAGMLAGAGEYIRGIELEAQERTCENMGADRCEFVIKPSDQFNALF